MSARSPLTAAGTAADWPRRAARHSLFTPDHGGPSITLHRRVDRALAIAREYPLSDPPHSLRPANRLQQGKLSNDSAAILACVVEFMRSTSIDSRVSMVWWAAGFADPYPDPYPNPDWPEQPWERLAYHWRLRYFGRNPNTCHRMLTVVVAIARSVLSGTIPREASASAFRPLSPIERISW